MFRTRMMHHLTRLATILSAVATSTQMSNAAAAPLTLSRDTTLSGQVICSRIEIPAGVTLSASADLLIESDDEIVIRGTLDAMASSSHSKAAGAHSGSSGVAITLRAKNRIIIDGEVRAGSGSSASPSAVLALNGYDGGTVILDAPIVYGRGAVYGGDGGGAAAGGRGGHGGSVEVLGLAGSTDNNDPFTLTGGAGGSGGSGTADVPNGGDGGDGGHAYASPLTDGTPGPPGSDVIITGCGSIGFPDGLFGFNGGNGGNGADAVGGNGGSGGPGSNGGQGGIGGQGGDAFSGCGGRGGHGGSGLSGSDGGRGGGGGNAIGGRGGDGGKGGNNCSPEGEASGSGGAGGNGGAGGTAIGRQGGNGGNGGNGTFGSDGEGGDGGRGGDATGGSGGTGGNGGAGDPSGAAGIGGSLGPKSAGAGGNGGVGSPSGIAGNSGTAVSGSTGSSGTSGSSCLTNLVYVESKSVGANESGITIGVFIANTDPLDILVLPLEIRSVTPGSYITGAFDFEFTPGGRVAVLNPPMSTIDQERGLTDPMSCSGPVSSSFTFGNAIDYVSPDAAMLVGQRIAGPSLPSGADPAGTASASARMVFNVTGTPGTFEIDTCCCRPANHLLYIDANLQSHVPAFTKGVITILPCGCDCHGDPICDGASDVQDVVATIGVAFRGAPPIPDPNANCPIETTDVDCDGITGIIDVVKIVSVTFRGANSLTEFCNPCL